MGRKSTCQYGTQQVKKDFMPWAQYITECLMGQFWCMILQMKTHFRRCVVILLWSGSVNREGYNTWKINSRIILWFLHISRFYDKYYFHLYSPALCPFLSSSTLSLFSFLCLPLFVFIIVLYLSPPFMLSVECCCYPHRMSAYHCTLHCITFSCSVSIYAAYTLSSDFFTICLLLNGL